MTHVPWFRHSLNEIKRTIRWAKRKLRGGARSEYVGCFGDALDREKRLGPIRDRRRKYRKEDYE